ncbi:hypothetical protein KCTC32516_01631 [Polaribacter huanghezhanensis]|uniref:hypothetical protein n=1 Tax=Polaribacter huanghezhanensis TaxID=1354726 RepID=UPI0026485BA9|nr:hypothetical protein [Polaribacter huanghezhanensis]WKD86265.1 hypothetical protein KCTC32516_01631 [Polaribacter huanghezhanensis]
MKTKTLGLTAAIIGIFMVIYTGFNYITKEKIVDIGSVEMSVNKSHSIQWSPIAGVVLLIGGIALAAISRKK